MIAFDSVLLSKVSLFLHGKQGAKNGRDWFLVFRGVDKIKNYFLLYKYTIQTIKTTVTIK